MENTQTEGGAQAAGPDYSAIAAAAYTKAEASHGEGGSNGSNDFDLAYNFAKDEIAAGGGEVDSNALFLALTAEKQKRIKDENPTP